MRLRNSPWVAAVLIVAGAETAVAQKHSPAVTRDADHDGVPDMRDRCPGTPVGFVVNSSGCPTGAVMLGVLPSGAAPASAAMEAPAPPVRERSTRTRVGLGAAIGGSSGSILLPILRPSGFSIEPSLGFTRTTSETTGFGIASHLATTGLLLGMSAGIPVAQTGSARFYVAPRFALVLLWAKMDNGGSITRSAPVDWTAGLGLGGEVFVTPQASAGGELGINYLRTDDDAGSGFTSKGSVLSVGGRVAVRWYFGG
jgi:hypothetical protein